jgi:hypothetical protein
VPRLEREAHRANAAYHKASFTIDTYVHLLDDELPEPEAISACK